LNMAARAAKHQYVAIEPKFGKQSMVKLTKIYTRGGDTGMTSLATGERRPKHDLRIEANGAVDVANSALGVARLHLTGDIDAMMSRVQNDLFDLGADLSTPDGLEGALRIIDGQVERLEHEIDGLNANLAPLNSFVLPGGSPAGAHLHLVRALVRSAERCATQLAEVETVNPPAIRYLNRLSDLLFQLARHANNDGADDVLWVPGANR
jgi:cob(I)alamin adenosyltransferase